MSRFLGLVVDNVRLVIDRENWRNPKNPGGEIRYAAFVEGRRTAGKPARLVSSSMLAHARPFATATGVKTEIV